MTRVQSPSIGNALRQALALDAAGGLPLTMEDSIVPVAIVADTAERNAGRRHYSGWAQSAAVAAQFPTVTLGITGDPGSNFRYAVPEYVHIRAGTATFVYWRLGINSPPATLDAVPRELRTDGSSPGALSVVRGATAVGVTAAQQNGLFYLPANVPLVFKLPYMEIRSPSPFATIAGITFQGDVANVDMVAEFSWDEYWRP